MIQFVLNKFKYTSEENVHIITIIFEKNMNLQHMIYFCFSEEEY